MNKSLYDVRRDLSEKTRPSRETPGPEMLSVCAVQNACDKIRERTRGAGGGRSPHGCTWILHPPLRRSQNLCEP